MPKFNVGDYVLVNYKYSSSGLVNLIDEPAIITERRLSPGGYAIYNVQFLNCSSTDSGFADSHLTLGYKSFQTVKNEKVIKDFLGVE